MSLPNEPAGLSPTHDEDLGSVPPASPPKRDPWLELRRGAEKLARCRAQVTRSLYDGSPTAFREELRQDADQAAAELGKLLAEVEICYMEVRVAHCTACDRLRRMSEPRRWEPEIHDLGGPAMTAECLYCGSTVAVPDEETARRGETLRTVGDGAA